MSFVEIALAVPGFVLIGVLVWNLLRHGIAEDKGDVTEQPAEST